MLPEALSNQRLLARARPGPPRGHGRAGARGRAACAAPRSTARLIRSDARLDYPRVDRIFAGDERAEAPWAAPLAAAREAAAALDAAREARGALAVESVEPEFAFSARGPRHRAAPRASRPSRTG